MKSRSKGISLVLAGLCLAASPAAGASKKACTVGATEAKAEAARFLASSNYTEIAWCPEAVPILIGMLEDKDLRQSAAAALRNATYNAASGTWRNDEVQAAAVPHLAAIAAATKRLAASKEMTDWGEAIMLQDVMGGMGKGAVTYLADGLQEASAAVRYGAATNLSKMGAKAAAALPALRAALKDEKDKTTAGEIRAAIKAIEGK